MSEAGKDVIFTLRILLRDDAIAEADDLAG